MGALGKIDGLAGLTNPAGKEVAFREMSSEWPRLVLGSVIPHVHIARLWVVADGQWVSREEMVRRVNAGQKFYVRGGGTFAYLVVDHTANGTAYVRTEFDSTRRDNLMALPELP